MATELQPSSSAMSFLMAGSESCRQWADMDDAPTPPPDDDMGTTLHDHHDNSPGDLPAIGQYMACSQTTTPIFTSSSSCAEYAVGVAWSQGGRDVMEDAHTVNLAVEAGCNPPEGKPSTQAMLRTSSTGPITCGALPPGGRVASGGDGADEPASGPGVGVGSPPAPMSDADGDEASGTERGGLVGLIACFDGHGGPEVANFCARNIAPVLCLAPAFDAGRGDLGASLTEAFLNLDEAVIKHASESGSGCCATVALLRGSELTVAGVGNTRAVLCRNGMAHGLTTAHLPSTPAESARITGAGGYIVLGRINACLNISRALGDASFKQTVGLPAVRQQVSPEPDIATETLGPGDFLLLACGGVWNAVADQDAVDFVRTALAEGKSPSTAAHDLVQFCLAPLVTTYDNVTAMVLVPRQE